MGVLCRAKPLHSGHARGSWLKKSQGQAVNVYFCLNIGELRTGHQGARLGLKHPFEALQFLSPGPLEASSAALQLWSIFNTSATCYVTAMKGVLLPVDSAS